MDLENCNLKYMFKYECKGCTVYSWTPTQTNRYNNHYYLWCVSCSSSSKDNKQQQGAKAGMRAMVRYGTVIVFILECVHVSSTGRRGAVIVFIGMCTCTQIVTPTANGHCQDNAQPPAFDWYIIIGVWSTTYWCLKVMSRICCLGISW